MSVEQVLIRKAQARLMAAGYKLQTALKLALSRGGRANFSKDGANRKGPLGEGTVKTLHSGMRRMITKSLRARGRFGGMTGRFGKRNLLGLVQRSKPGEPPMMQSGRGRNSISVRRIDPFTVRVGTNVPYLRMLEFGTKGGKVIVPKNAKVLFDPVSRRFFGKRVVQGAIKPRPFFRPTIQRMRGVIMSTMAGVA